jgi:hypothetical protein
MLPARYYVTLLQTIFLAGDIWAVILRMRGARRMAAVFFADSKSDSEKIGLKRTMLEAFSEYLRSPIRSCWRF